MVCDRSESLWEEYNFDLRWFFTPASANAFQAQN